MNKGLTAVAVLILTGACLAAAVFMPLAELGLLNGPQDMPIIAEHLASSWGMESTFRDLHGTVDEFVKATAKDPNFPYYVYSFFLGAAMIAAALALGAVGAEESEEKTVLPQKK